MCAGGIYSLINKIYNNKIEQRYINQCSIYKTGSYFFHSVLDRLFS